MLREMTRSVRFEMLICAMPFNEFLSEHLIGGPRGEDADEGRHFGPFMHSVRSNILLLFKLSSKSLHWDDI